MTTYDANGNTLLDNTGGAFTTYTWDSNNRLLVNATPSIAITSNYSLDGKRQSIRTSGTNHYFGTCDWQEEQFRSLNINGAVFNYFSMPDEWGSRWSRHCLDTAIHYTTCLTT